MRLKSRLVALEKASPENELPMVWFSQESYQRMPESERPAFLDNIRRGLCRVIVFSCEGEPSPMELL